MERLTQPLNHRNTIGEINPKVHGMFGTPSLPFESGIVQTWLCIGPLDTSLPADKISTDDIVLEASQQLSSEFPFNLDY